MIKLTRKSMLLYTIKPLFALFLLCGVFAIVWLRTSLVAIEYEINALENRKTKLQKETRLLIAERAEHLSFQKMKLVTTKEGLSRADRTRVLIVKRTSDTQKASYSLKR